MAGADGGDRKRKGPWKARNGADGGDTKRYKGHMQGASNAKGCGGVLVTCDKTKERQSVRDALNILNDAADQYFPSAEKEPKEETDTADETQSRTTSEEGVDSVQKMLQEEIAALKSDAKNRQTGRFTALDTGVKGVILIQFQDASISPMELLSKIFAEVESSKEFSSRFINRMIPLEKVGHSSVDAIKEVAKPLIEAHFRNLPAEEADSAVSGYAVEIKRRNCTHLKSMDVINAVVELVGAEHKVNLTTPKSVIVIEVFRNTCGVSVVTNFHQTMKFNVRSVLDPPVKGVQDQKKVKAVEEAKPAEAEATANATEDTKQDAVKNE